MSFAFQPTEIPDVVVVVPARHADERGVLMEAYRRSEFASAGIALDLVQENVVRSGPRVVRGLHYQLPPASQGKLVGVVRGAVFDVAVDLRQDSGTFGRWVGTRLGADDGRMMWIPPGFAHGYAVLGDGADVVYRLTSEYDPGLERGIRWDDPTLDVSWPFDDPVLSDKDRALPSFADAEVGSHG
jgi:dTDP-4-dehydrorhamnose 3,5-epimerase